MADETYVEISDETYAALLAGAELNQYARREALEEARAWCQAHHGTETLAEGLRACTPDELYTMYRTAMGTFADRMWVVDNLMAELVRRLNDRETKREMARHSLWEMERAAPPEGEG